MPSDDYRPMTVRRNPCAECRDLNGRGVGRTEADEQYAVDADVDRLEQARREQHTLAFCQRAPVDAQLKPLAMGSDNAVHLAQPVGAADVVRDQVAHPHGYRVVMGM